MKYLILIGISTIIYSCQDQSISNQVGATKSQESFFPDTILSYSTGQFPNQWDLNRELRKSDKEVLGWKHIKNGRGKELRVCITYQEKLDSAGNNKIYIEELESKPPNFNEWQTSLISYAPDLSTPNSIGYHDWLLRSFEHKPTKKEIYKMLEEFKFSVRNHDWMTIEAGIDLELWTKKFGFTPENYLTKKNGL